MDRFILLPYILSLLIFISCNGGGGGSSEGQSSQEVVSKEEVTINSIRPNRGIKDGGTIISIFGSGFFIDSNITVGGVKCPVYEIISSKEILCTAPPGSVGQKDILINNKASLPNAFTYYDNLTFSPSQKKMEIGSVQKLQVFGGSGKYTYSADRGLINDDMYTAPNSLGIDTIKAFDEDGNTSIAMIEIKIPLSISPSTYELLEVGKEMTFSASGGSMPYSFSTYFGSINEKSGIYTAPNEKGAAKITVTDGDGDKKSAEIFVYLLPSIEPKEVILGPGNTFDKFLVKEGFPPYVFSTDLGTINEKGYYTASPREGRGIVTVTDAAKNKIFANIIVNPPLTLNPSSISLKINEPYEFKPSGGVPPYSFSSVIPNAISVLSGIYTATSTSGEDMITVTDSLENTTTSKVFIYSELAINPPAITLAPNATVTFSVFGGVPPYKFSSDSQTITQDPDDSTKAIYTFPQGVASERVWVLDKNENVAYAEITGDFSNFWSFIKGIDPTPPARHFGSSWSDSAGNFWIFGGFSDNYLNDLWKFDTKAKKWDLFNTTLPARSEAASCIDSYGKTWVFGGRNGDSFLDDFWTYDSNLNKWDEVKTQDDKGKGKPETDPGQRSGSVCWFDNDGNFFLFGGYRLESDGPDFLNDLWEFDPKPNHPDSQRWKKINLVSNIPGPRNLASSWKDKTGFLWLFGGSTGEGQYLNDLWKYNVTDKRWINVNGSLEKNKPGIYQGNNASPGARSGSVIWPNPANGNIFLFGGIGFSILEFGYLNDLWKFDGNIWTWVSGSQEPNQPGFYENNSILNPGGLAGASGGIDSEGNLWLFGGRDHNSGVVKDLWKYAPK